MTTQPSTKAMVRSYIKINRPQPVSVIAHALDLTMAEVQHALDALELESRQAAEDELFALGVWSGNPTIFALDAAKAQGEVMTHTPQGRVRVEYRAGEYSVTR
jgi:hypothetical protein